MFVAPSPPNPIKGKVKKKRTTVVNLDEPESDSPTSQPSPIITAEQRRRELMRADAAVQAMGQNHQHQQQQQQQQRRYSHDSDRETQRDTTAETQHDPVKRHGSPSTFVLPSVPIVITPQATVPISAPIKTSTTSIGNNTNSIKSSLTPINTTRLPSNSNNTSVSTPVASSSPVPSLSPSISPSAAPQAAFTRLARPPPKRSPLLQSVNPNVQQPPRPPVPSLSTTPTNAPLPNIETEPSTPIQTRENNNHDTPSSPPTPVVESVQPVTDATDSTLSSKTALTNIDVTGQAFDNRDEETKAKFLAMIGGGKKKKTPKKKGDGSKKRKSRTSDNTTTNSPTLNLTLPYSASFPPTTSAPTTTTHTPPEEEKVTERIPDPAAEDAAVSKAVKQLVSTGNTSNDNFSMSQTAPEISNKKTDGSETIRPLSPSAASSSSSVTAAALAALSKAQASPSKAESRNIPPVSTTSVLKATPSSAKSSRAALAALSSKLLNVAATYTPINIPPPTATLTDTATHVPSQSSPGIVPSSETPPSHPENQSQTTTTQPTESMESKRDNVAVPHSAVLPAVTNTNSTIAPQSPIKNKSFAMNAKALLKSLSPRSSPKTTPKAEQHKGASASPSRASSRTDIHKDDHSKGGISPASNDDNDEEDESAAVDEVVMDNDDKINSAGMNGVARDRKEELEVLDMDERMPWQQSPINASSTAPTSPALGSKRTSESATKEQSSPAADHHDSDEDDEADIPKQQQQDHDSVLAVSNDDDDPHQPSHAQSPIPSKPSSPRGSLVSSVSASSFFPSPTSPTYFSRTYEPTVGYHGQHMKLILYPIKRQRRRILIPKQDGKCPTCDTKLKDRMFNRPRYCAYTGLYYCHACHSNQRCSIPGRILFFNDYKTYKCCELAASYLTSIIAIPMIPMAAINPAVYRGSKKLRYCFLLRQQLAYLRPFVMVCPDRDGLLALFGDRTYMLNDTPILSTASRGVLTNFQEIRASQIHDNTTSIRRPTLDVSCHDMYAIKDLIECQQGLLMTRLSVIVSTLIDHVTNSECNVCSAAGILCEGDGCIDRRPIYLFQLKSVIQCSKCYHLFHRNTCWNGEGLCPWCIRHQDSQESSYNAKEIARQWTEQNHIHDSCTTDNTSNPFTDNNNNLYQSDESIV